MIPIDEYTLEAMSWDGWKDAEESAHTAFLQRSPADRLAWLEDVLRLRAAAALVCANSGQNEH